MSQFSNACSKCNSSSCTCKPSCTTSRCAPKSSGCQPVVPLSSPYYLQAPGCVQDHCSQKFIELLAGGVKVINAFNMPGCDLTAVLQVEGITVLPVGAYLWAPSVGYLQIISFNAYTGQIVVENNCNVGNAAAGTVIPGCTVFAITDPPAVGSGGSTTGIFVAIDFTAPNVGNCILITVTGVAGLAVGKNVQIGSGTYRIESIPGATTLGICNDGSGITPGSPVIAKNGPGDYVYPITLIDTNPCTNDPGTPGLLLVCVDDITVPLAPDGAPIGSVPRLIDEDGNVEFQALEVPTRTCTSVTCCFAIFSGNAGPYTIPVVDSSEFVVGDIVQIGSRSDRLTITDIPDGTHITGTLSPVPGASVDIAIGTSICIIECCEDLQNQIDALDALVGDNLVGDINKQGEDDVVNTLISSGGTTEYTQDIATDPDTGTITNTSLTHNMLVEYNVLFRIFGAFQSGAGAGSIEFQGLIAETYDGGGPVVTPYGFRKGVQAALGADEAYDISFTIPRSVVLLPGGTHSLRVTAGCKVVLAGTAEYFLETMSAWIVGFNIING